MTDAERYEVEELRHDAYESRCPACGDVIDYCQGHGEIGDPEGYAILQAHDDGDHSGCHDEEECKWLLHNHYLPPVPSTGPAKPPAPIVTANPRAPWPTPPAAPAESG